MRVKLLRSTLAAVIVVGASFSVSAAQPVVVQDFLTGASSSYPWKAFNGACLTAGDGSASTIPACTATDTSVSPSAPHVGGYTGTLPDPVGNGALRLTNSHNNESGAVISTQSFPLNAGVLATFTTVTYAGDSGGAGKDGADGISFFLMDAAQPPNIGSWGGSLGYSCSNSNTPYVGMTGAYVGLGIDEYGNFLNQSDNTASGYGYQPGRIGLRGGGSIAFPALTAAYGTDPGDSTKPYYPASLATTCVNGGAYNQVAKSCATAICSSGTAYNIANGDCETPLCSGSTLYNSTYNNCETPVCGTGTYYQSSASACQSPTCGSGTYYQASASACQTPTCGSGKYYQASASACQTPTCGSGTYYQSGPNACQTPVCATGTYYQSGASACQTPTCSSGKYYQAGASACQLPTCGSGTYYQSGANACQIPTCGSGTYYQSGANACQTPTCGSGKYYQSGANACQTPTCSTGTYYQAGANACQTPTCGTGTYYQAGASACQTPTCSSGKYYQSGASVCQLPTCGSGTYYQSGVNACQTPTCGTGTYYQSGASACQTPTCSSGKYYQSGANACQTPTCGSGKYYQLGANACQTPSCTSGGVYNSGTGACSTGTLSWSGGTAPTWGSSVAPTWGSSTAPSAWNGTTAPTWGSNAAPTWGSSTAPSAWNGTTAPTWGSNAAPTWGSSTAPSAWNGTTAPTWGSNAAPTWGSSTAPSAWNGTTAPSWSGTAQPTWGGGAQPVLWSGSTAPTFTGTATGTLTYGGTATGTLTYGTLSNSQPNSVLAVKNTCQTGNLYNYKSPINPTSAGTATLSNSKNTAKILDYAPIPNAYQVLPAGQPLANESATTRADAVPITYQLKITQAGLLSLNYSYNGGTYNPVITNQDITASNGALPSAGFLFGFAGSTGGSRNVHEITCFQATSADQSSTSAAVNVQQTAKINTGTQVYLAYYNQNYWSGQLTSQNLVYDPNTLNVSISSTVNWDASCVLTGGACNSTNSANVAEAPNNRIILSWNGSAGIPFEWSSAQQGATSITAAQQGTLDQGDATPINANRLNFLRGDRSNEINASGVGLYRARFSVLGDIIDSTPTWVGPPAAGYGATWGDALYSSATVPENASTAQTYPQFSTSSTATRLNVIYSGANDGMLHGFRSGSYDSSGNYVSNSTTPNDGSEVLAYVPGAVVQTIHNVTNSALDYSSPQYSHNFYVDGTPATGDLFYGGAWHTWLVGGLGAGGSAIYALDITDPTQFSEANASSLVIGEWTTTLTCANAPNCGANNLGNTYGTPQIRRFHNGMWGFIFGNGYNSATGSAGIFVVTVDPATGARTFYFLDTGYGPSKDPSSNNTNNGIYYATPADLDGDHVTDYVYAGDLFGNVWRFDLTNNDPTKWAVVSTPLFSSPVGQPITTKLMVASVPSLIGAPRVMIDFGTGQQIPQTIAGAAQYSSAQQALYGIWDWNMVGWNALSTTRYAALTAPQTITTSSLQQQTILGTYNSAGTGTGNGLRTVSNTPVCWQGSTQCSSGNNKYGWYFPLITSTGAASPEQVIYSPILEFGSFIVNTTIPANNSPTTCSASTATGWTMALDPGTGGAFQNSFFGTSSKTFIAISNQIVSGIALNAVGSPSVVTANNSPYLVNQTVTGVGAVNAINPPGGAQSKRLTWIQKR